MEISLPPLEEQRAIARVLGALDDKIELNRRMSETLEEMARALFRSWFVDFDPVRAKAEGRPSGLPPDLDALFPASFEASELGEIPAGWEVRRRWGSSATSRSTATHSRRQDDPVGPKFLRIDGHQQESLGRLGLGAVLRDHARGLARSTDSMKATF